jgi:hypothetical protein
LILEQCESWFSILDNIISELVDRKVLVAGLAGLSLAHSDAGVERSISVKGFILNRTRSTVVAYFLICLAIAIVTFRPDTLAPITSSCRL